MAAHTLKLQHDNRMPQIIAIAEALGHANRTFAACFTFDVGIVVVILGIVLVEWVSIMCGAIRAETIGSPSIGPRQQIAWSSN